MKKIIITRKIELIVLGTPEEKTQRWDTLRTWSRLTMKAANQIATHWFIQKNTEQLAYFSEDFKKDNPEIFTKGAGWSHSNRTYRLIAEYYGGQLPSAIYSTLNNQMISKLEKTKTQLNAGLRSLDSFSIDIPMPFPAGSIIGIEKATDKKNYLFTWFKIPFVTRFGRDLSGNRIIWDRMLAGEYKLCDSKIQVDGKKVYLLATLGVDVESHVLKEKNIMTAELSLDCPIKLNFKTKEYLIGYKEEFLGGRIAIQEGRRRQQIIAKYNRGGKGRKKKLANVARFKDREINYVTTKQHAYSKKVVDLCLKNKCSELFLKLVPKIKLPEDLSKAEKKKYLSENEPLLRAWSYYGLTEKLKYKCARVGIKLVVEEDPEEKENKKKSKTKQPVEEAVG